MEKKEFDTQRWDEYVQAVEDFTKDKKEIMGEIEGLTPHILKEHLEEAVQYKKGYYKNDKGQYEYVKGIEVTNDVSNLCRMGFNGEDRGVWIHYCIIDDDSVRQFDSPVFMFSSQFNPRITPKDELMKPTTKEDFDAQVERTVKNLIADYPEKRNPQEYLDYMEGFDKLCEEYKDVLGMVFPGVFEED